MKQTLQIKLMKARIYLLYLQKKKRNFKIFQFVGVQCTVGCTVYTAIELKKATIEPIPLLCDIRFRTFFSTQQTIDI